ncbi:MauE/DoxX family redox-associated membrane protein [uncultured Chryseobacterium sp.]|uniref:MauE/DoxX family redox-associated membrane protein n=1 Tax=uncultured Chryseobacterium sp. TaxID=259322 RepID=UPI0025CEC34A|nr:MauE/DoxX family redox-associated membrane protein [uncultured Chryseobacterium sp.]
MRNFQNIFIKAVSYFFMLLFFYAAISKMMDFENFRVQIAQSPLLTSFAGFIAYTVIGIELLVCFLLAFPRTHLAGQYASLSLMSAFTIYIYIILHYSEYIPCSCGGILEKMSWTQHLVFNVFCVLLSMGAIIMLRKNKRWVRPVVLGIVLPIFLVIGLYLSSESRFKNENNFTRRYFPNALVEDSRISLDHQFYYFAGSNSEHLFLGDLTSPLTMKKVTPDLTTVQDLKVNLDSYDHFFKRLRLTVKDHYYYFSDGSVPIIYRGKLNQPIAKTVSYRQVYFNQFIPIDSSRFVFRTISAKTRSFTLGIQKYDTGAKAVMHPEILRKQADGIFDSDGNLISTPQAPNLIYTYMYRNQFIVMDEQLSVLNRENTIDTTSVAKIRTKTLSDGRTKMNAPPLKVNKLQTAVNDVLFNQSDLMGKNESEKRWKSSWAIDLYHFRKKQYAGSFYIPHRKGKKLTGFWASRDRIYVLTGSELISYRYRDHLLQAINQ